MFTVLVAAYQRLLETLTVTKHRYLYSSFNIKSRLTGIVGPRGVGKTTLMLQYIQENLHGKTPVIYFSADHIIFNQYTLLDCVDHFYQTNDIRLFFIDEIHKYKNWQQEIKNIYDSYPTVKVVFSGSSSIDLIHGSYDLSRRARLYFLHGLSFREFLNFKTGQDIPPISFDDLLAKKHTDNINLSLIPQVQGHFKEYLKYGYYPFYFEEPETYYERILRIIDKSIYEDIASFYNLKTESLHLFKKIIIFLSTIPPGNINTHNLAKNLSIDDKTASHYLTILNQVGLIRLVYSVENGNAQLRKPEKIFLDNTTLFHVLQETTNGNPEVGTVRELFFLQSMMNASIKVHYNKIGDFETHNAIFEIGGKNKTAHQIKGSKKPAFLVKDDILLGEKNAIPLFYFGFLY